MNGPPDRPTDLTKLVLRGASLATVGHLSTQLVSFATYLVLARLVTPHAFGQFAAGSILLGVGLLVSESGMLAAVVQRRDRLDEAASTAFVATVLGGVLLSLASLALAPVVGVFFGSREIGWIAAALAGYIALQQPMIVPDALLQRGFSFLRRVVLEPVGAVAFGVVAIATTAAGLGVWGLVIGMYAGVVVRLVLSWRLVRWRPERRLVSYAMWRELASFGRHVIAAEGVQVGYTQGQTALVGRGVGTAALGQFGYAYRIATQPAGILINGLSYVLLPALARIADDRDRFCAAVLRSLRLVAVLALPTSLILFALGEPITVLVFGSEWRPAGKAVAALCGFSAGWGFVSLAGETWKAAGQPQWLPRTRLLGAFLGLGLLAVAVPFGLTAAAASLSVTSVLTAAYALWGVSRVLRTSVVRLVPPLWPALAASVVMAGAVFALESLVEADRRGTAGGIALVLAEGVLAVLLYVATLAVLSPDTGRDLMRGASLLRSRLHRRGAAAVGPGTLP